MSESLKLLLLFFFGGVGQSGNVEALRSEVRKAFKANMNETDPEKIHTMKEA